MGDAILGAGLLCSAIAISRRTADTNLLKQRGLSPVKGPIQDGSDAVT
ncbi:hypothetical protein AB0O76_38915 [Streptomyces sp. NPDC086554]